MAQGKAVDYGIVSPAHMSTFSKAAPFIDAPCNVSCAFALMEKMQEKTMPATAKRNPLMMVSSPLLW